MTSSDLSAAPNNFSPLPFSPSAAPLSPPTATATAGGSNSRFSRSSGENCEKPSPLIFSLGLVSYTLPVLSSKEIGLWHRQHGRARPDKANQGMARQDKAEQASSSEYCCMARALHAPVGHFPLNPYCSAGDGCVRLFLHQNQAQSLRDTAAVKRTPLSNLKGAVYHAESWLTRVSSRVQYSSSPSQLNANAKVQMWTRLVGVIPPKLFRGKGRKDLSNGRLYHQPEMKKGED